MKLKLVKFDYRKDQIEKYTKIGFPVHTRADSKSTNSDPMQNDSINIHKTKINMESKSKNMIKKSEHVSKYVFQERGVTFHPPYKNSSLKFR